MSALLRSETTGVRFGSLRTCVLQAMTDNDSLGSVTFSLYQKVHIRISKTLAPDFTEQEAREVAKDDFRSDTQGAKLMTQTQLTDSLYELACLWAKAQLEQLGHKCETEHLVYFLTEIFKNIADELIKEARRLVSLKELDAIEDQQEAMQSSFRTEFQDFEKKKATLKQIAAANKAKRMMEQAAQEAEEKRKREEEEARRAAAEAAAAKAEKEEHDAVGQGALREWEAMHAAAKVSLDYANDRLRAAQQRREGQLAELDQLLRKMARLDAVRVRMKLAHEDTTAVIDDLHRTREVWERKSDTLLATERMIAELHRAVEAAERAIVELPDQPGSGGSSGSGQQDDELAPESSVRSGGRFSAWSPSPPVSPTQSPGLRTSSALAVTRGIGRGGGSIGRVDSRYGGGGRPLQTGPSVVCLHVPGRSKSSSSSSSSSSSGSRTASRAEEMAAMDPRRMEMRRAQRRNEAGAGAGSRRGTMQLSQRARELQGVVMRQNRLQQAQRDSQHYVGGQKLRMRIEANENGTPVPAAEAQQQQQQQQQMQMQPRSQSAAALVRTPAPPTTAREPRHPEQAPKRIPWSAQAAPSATTTSSGTNDAAPAASRTAAAGDRQQPKATLPPPRPASAMAAAGAVAAPAAAAGKTGGGGGGGGSRSARGYYFRGSSSARQQVVPVSRAQTARALTPAAAAVRIPTVRPEVLEAHGLHRAIGAIAADYTQDRRPFLLQW